jgi:hypothetical protein
VITDPTIRYRPETGTLAIELRPWPADVAGGASQNGGEDAGPDLVIHYAADGILSTSRRHSNRFAV